MLVYDVTYHLDGEKRTDRVIAASAAGAAQRVSRGFEDVQGRFELLLVRLLDRRADASADLRR